MAVVELNYSVNSLQTATSALEGNDSGLSGNLIKSSASVLRTVSVHLHKLGKIKLGLLQNLHLADEDVLQGEDRLALLFDLLADGLGQRNAGNRREQRISALVCIHNTLSRQ